MGTSSIRRCKWKQSGPVSASSARPRLYVILVALSLLFHSSVNSTYMHIYILLCNGVALLLCYVHCKRAVLWNLYNTYIDVKSTVPCIRMYALSVGRLLCTV